MSFFFTRPSLLKPHEGDTVHVVSELWNQMLSQNKAELVLLILLFMEKLCFFSTYDFKRDFKTRENVFFPQRTLPICFRLLKLVYRMKQYDGCQQVSAITPTYLQVKLAQCVSLCFSCLALYE